MTYKNRDSVQVTNYTSMVKGWAEWISCTVTLPVITVWLRTVLPAWWPQQNARFHERGVGTELQWLLPDERIRDDRPSAPTFHWQQSTVGIFHATLRWHFVENLLFWDSHQQGLERRGNSSTACLSIRCSPRN